MPSCCCYVAQVAAYHIFSNRQRSNMQPAYNLHHAVFCAPTCLEAVSRVTSLPLLRSTTLLHSCSTNSSRPGAAAAAHTCATAPNPSCRRAGTAAACAAAMLKTAGAKWGLASRACMCCREVLLMAASGLRGCEGSSSSESMSDRAATPSHLRHQLCMMTHQV
jgi:hypothetical protein